MPNRHVYKVFLGANTCISAVEWYLQIRFKFLTFLLFSLILAFEVVVIIGGSSISGISVNSSNTYSPW